jgi:hypothetical protein
VTPTATLTQQSRTLGRRVVERSRVYVHVCCRDDETLKTAKQTSDERMRCRLLCVCVVAVEMMRH